MSFPHAAAKSPKGGCIAGGLSAEGFNREGDRGGAGCSQGCIGSVNRNGMVRVERDVLFCAGAIVRRAGRDRTFRGNVTKAGVSARKSRTDRPRRSRSKFRVCVGLQPGDRGKMSVGVRTYPTKSRSESTSRAFVRMIVARSRLRHAKLRKIRFI